MPRKKKVIKEKEEEKKPKYHLTVSLNGQVFESDGNTVLEAVQKIPEPVKVVTKGLVTLTDGIKNFEQMWMPFRLRRLFRPIAQPTQAKYLSWLLK